MYGSSRPRQSPLKAGAFFATNATLNGGEAGPGGVTGFCVCQNAQATDAEVLAMTPESELADFEAVTSVPAGAMFSPDALTPAMIGWVTQFNADAAANPERVFLVRLADTTPVTVAFYRCLYALPFLGAIALSEKNRFGPDGVDLEYRKRFEQGRFEAEGREVTEQLIDDRIFVE